MNESPSSDLQYIIYKTTNQINGKYYVGKHQTKNIDDGYQGSGKLLKRAIRKYGVENFQTEILEVYDQEWKMDLAEKILVVTDPEVSYNLCSGGHGGFGYINQNLPNEKRIEISRKGGLAKKVLSELSRQKLSEAGKKFGRQNLLKGRPKGFTLSEEHKRKISEARKARSL